MSVLSQRQLLSFSHCAQTAKFACEKYISLNTNQNSCIIIAQSFFNSKIYLQSLYLVLICTFPSSVSNIIHSPKSRCLSCKSTQTLNIKVTLKIEFQRIYNTKSFNTQSRLLLRKNCLWIAWTSNALFILSIWISMYHRKDNAWLIGDIPVTMVMVLRK